MISSSQDLTKALKDQERKSKTRMEKLTSMIQELRKSLDNQARKAEAREKELTSTISRNCRMRLKGRLLSLHTGIKQFERKMMKLLSFRGNLISSDKKASVISQVICGGRFLDLKYNEFPNIRLVLEHGGQCIQPSFEERMLL